VRVRAFDLELLRKLRRRKNEPQNIEQRITNAEGEKRRDLTSSFEIPWSPFISLWLAGAAEGG